MQTCWALVHYLDERRAHEGAVCFVQIQIRIRDPLVCFTQILIWISDIERSVSECEIHNDVGKFLIEETVLFEILVQEQFEKIKLFKM